MLHLSAQRKWKIKSIQYWQTKISGKHFTWRSARALQTLFDCAGVRFGGDNTGYI